MRNALGTEIRATAFVRDADEDLESLRDDCIALFINSGLTQKQVAERGGPRPQTISKWLYKETRFPRYETIQSFLTALGHKLAVVNQLSGATFIRTGPKPKLKKPRKKS